MKWFGELSRKLLFPFRKRQFDRDLQEEIRFHLEMKGDDRKSFGNITLSIQDCREAWGWAAVEAWLADLRHALRALRRNPSFTIVAMVTMALGIGSTTAIFSVVNSVLLRPLPFPEPERLATLWMAQPKNRVDRGVVSYPMFQDWKRQAKSFEHIGAWDGSSAQMTVAGEPVEIPGAEVSPGFFEALGARPLLGRIFLPEEHWRSAPKVIILSYRLWRRLGGDAALSGKTVQLGRTTYTVAGVMPQGFEFPPGWSELWFPHAGDDSRNDGARYLRVVARLRPGVSALQARSELNAITARLQTSGDGANVVQLNEQIVGDARRVLVVLMGAVGCVFLIACSNVANLLLVRATGRRRDLALRLALGAGRWRIVRCLLAESLALAVAGGAVGVAAAYGLVRLFVAIDPVHLPRVQEVAVDGTALLWAAAATIVTGIAFGLFPAIRSSRPELATWLKDGAPGSGEFGRNRSRGILAAAQVALAVMLLVGAGLLLRSFVARMRTPLGFRPEGSIGVDLPWSANRGIDDLMVKLRAVPGVTAAGASTSYPHSAPPYSCDGCVEIEGVTLPKDRQDDTGLLVATTGYFEAAGMQLRSGRFFTPADGKDSPKVVVINEAMARRDFPGLDPVGRRVRQGRDWAAIVGVVGNARGFGHSGEPISAVYFPNSQYGWPNPVKVLVRTSVPPASLTAAVRKEIRAWKPQLVIQKLDTVDNLLSSSVAAPRFYLLLMAGFAALALAVSVVGVYGTVNYSVARRTHEIGIRMALGAQRADVLGMILGEGVALVGAGAAIGLAGAWAAARMLETLLFGIRPTDGIAFAGGAGILVIAALLACYVPARRATRTDPVNALRHG
jgi:putative ABC transport system permease protein